MGYINNPSISQWTLAGSFVYAGVPVATVNFVGLGTPQEILILLEDLTPNLSSNASMRVSSNNGASYFSGATDYSSFGSSGNRINSAQAWFANSVSTLHKDCWLQIEAAQSNHFKSVISPNPVANPTNKINRNEIINAIQVFFSSGNIIGGSIYVYTR